jgi:Sulfotransferase family
VKESLFNWRDFSVFEFVGGSTNFREMTMALQASVSEPAASTSVGAMIGTAQVPIMTHARADVLYIGFPKAASTFIARFLESHPETTVDQFELSDLLLPGRDAVTARKKPFSDKIHVSKDENVAESVCVIGEWKNWHRNLYVPGGWNRVRNDVIIDPAEAASRLYRVHPDAKVLMVIREQGDWLQSVYKFVMSQLPWNRRSFADYCTTPSGIVLLQAGHFDRTIRAYVDVFGAHRVGVLRFEELAGAPMRFAAELCGFIGVSERPLPKRRENETHAQIARIQRFFPFIERLPRKVKSALKPAAMRFTPGARAAILSSRDLRMLRAIYAVSNHRTEKLIRQLST